MRSGVWRVSRRGERTSRRAMRQRNDQRRNASCAGIDRLSVAAASARRVSLLRHSTGDGDCDARTLLCQRPSAARRRQDSQRRSARSHRRVSRFSRFYFSGLRFVCSDSIGFLGCLRAFSRYTDMLESRAKNDSKLLTQIAALKTSIQNFKQ